ncbi:DUF3168 domain-containing protein [Neorhizobium lilium]|uniref:DUF3168 domain-containing protein n=1 Tax=Neorhizobium lilium TaxID=2503024 RepID=A0A444LDV3_9HYPH|nr:DUF3168 domain-containing protein [Neorhizobium lilium]RWX76011.1 DUF3168 domain-containing protein [Neorhizobium lilium]
MKSAQSLLAALFQRLSSDAALVAMLGADGVRDRLLPRPSLPCIVFGDMETRDISADDGKLDEHVLTLEVWSDGEGRRQGQEVAGRVHTLLHEADLDLDLGDTVLVNLQVTSLRTRREPKTKYYLAEVRLRAVTE